MKGYPLISIAIDPELKLESLFLYRSLYELLQKKFSNISDTPNYYLHRPTIFVSNKIVNDELKNSNLFRVFVGEGKAKNSKNTYFHFKGLEDLNELDSRIDQFVSLHLKNYRKMLLEKIEQSIEQIAPYIQLSGLKPDFSDLPEIEKLQEYLIKKFKQKNVLIKNETELAWNDISEAQFVYPLILDDLIYYMIKIGKEEKKDFYDFIASLIIEFGERNQLSQSFVDDKKNIQLNSRILNELGSPVALFNQEQELLIYNQQFTKLGLPPVKCFTLEHESIFEGKSGVHYKVLKNSFTDGKQSYLLIVFQLNSGHDFKQSNSQSTPEDLGIISSSIAHELNNPLAGILAAISLILLDDISTDVEADLKEMKLSATRAKTLIETFLGFSRMNPQQAKSGNLSIALEQALNLLRFRLVESNLKLHIDKNFQHSSLINVNTSIFCMVFYLILGELLTALAHGQLIKGNKEDRELKLHIESFGQGFSLQVLTEMEFSNSLLHSKLVKHLLEIEGFQLLIEDQTIFINRKIKDA